MDHYDHYEATLMQVGGEVLISILPTNNITAPLLRTSHSHLSIQQPQRDEGIVKSVQTLEVWPARETNDGRTRTPRLGCGMKAQAMSHFPTQEAAQQLSTPHLQQLAATTTTTTLRCVGEWRLEESLIDVMGLSGTVGTVSDPGGFGGMDVWGGTTFWACWCLGRGRDCGLSLRGGGKWCCAAGRVVGMDGWMGA
jgi:hypothetical protein